MVGGVTSSRKASSNILTIRERSPRPPSAGEVGARQVARRAPRWPAPAGPASAPDTSGGGAPPPDPPPVPAPPARPAGRSAGGFQRWDRVSSPSPFTATIGTGEPPLVLGSASSGCRAT